MKTRLMIAAIALCAAPAVAATAAKPAAKASPQQRVEKREGKQTKRIEMGIKKGALTEQETLKLDALEKSIQQLDSSFEGQGKLTKAEIKQLRQALKDASLQIWAEKHDTEGTQLPVHRLGKDIFADDALTEKIESGSFTRADAKTFVHELAQMVHIKKRLANETLSDAERAALQEKFNDLLNKYFQQK